MVNTSRLRVYFIAQKETLFVIACSLIIALGLFAAIWDMNFWPTDVKVYYVDAAARLPSLKYISQLHESMDQTSVRWFHGKEMFILSGSFFQRLFNDAVSIKPFITVCILSFFVSSIFVFLIAKKFWGRGAGFISYFLFITCFWPYQYVLFVIHQPLGLAFFLLAFALLLFTSENKISKVLYVVSGAALCLSIYSSSTASLYAPYYLAGFLYISLIHRRTHLKKTGLAKNFALDSFLCLLGFSIAFIYFNYPDVVYNVKGYLEYVSISRLRSHFYYNQPVLIQWIPHPNLPVRGGWLWIVRYFFTILPVLFSFYIFCIFYLFVHCFREERKNMRIAAATLMMILVSLSTLILAESKGVAQLGRNYFTFLIGMILLIGYAFFIFINSTFYKQIPPRTKRFVFIGLSLVFACNIFVNFKIFFFDLYPTRMATRSLSQIIKDKNISTIFTHYRNPHRESMASCLDPDLVRGLQFINTKNITQPESGAILIPPVTGDSIYKAAHSSFNDFDKDVFLNELFRKGNISEYAIASFDTLTSSKIWLHESEILSYKTLILNHPAEGSSDRTKVWLLDAKKIRTDTQKNLPSKEYVLLARTGIRNIGTKSPVYRFDGFNIRIDKPTVFQGIPMRIFKIGDPNDQLQAYVYKVAPDELLWIPLNEDFKLVPVGGRGITTDISGQTVGFRFSKPQTLSPGKYKIVVYRTGDPDDRNFYRIYPRL